MTYLNTKSWRYFKILLLVFVFYSLNCWPFFSANDMVMRFSYPILAIPFFLKKTFWDTSQRRVSIAILLAVLYVYCSGTGNLNKYIFALMGVLPLTSIVLLKDEYLMDLLESFQKILYPLLALGAVFWILHLAGYDLPSTEVTFGTALDSKGNVDAQYYFSNHYLYLVNDNWFMRSDSEIPSFFRFSSIFCEPGYFAILLTFLLFINKFNMKDKRNIVYVVSLVLTLSLAGFIMSLFAYIANRLELSRKRISTLVGIGVVVTIAYFFFSNYNDGNNAINEAIISRLEVDEDKGIAGNNRTSEALDDQFAKLLTSSDLLFGISARDEIEFGVGYKAFMMKNGLFGLVLFLWFLTAIAKRAGNYRSWILFSLFVLMFARGDGTMFYAAFILIYTAGVTLTKYNITKEE